MQQEVGGFIKTYSTDLQAKYVNSRQEIRMEGRKKGEKEKKKERKKEWRGEV